MAVVKSPLAQFKSIRSGINNATRNAALEGARVVRDKARTLVSRDSGRGARQIQAVRKQSRPGEGIAHVGWTRWAFYLRFLERGAKPHPIVARAIGRIRNVKTREIIGKPVRGKVRALAFFFSGTRLLVFRRSIPRHPGTPKRPFLQPALDQSKPQVIEAVGNRYQIEIAKAAGRRGIV